MASIVIASGKGGVGKSTVSLNLAILFIQAGRRAIIVDGDARMPSLGVLMGFDKIPISLNNVLREENDVNEAVYEGPGGLKFVPASIAAEQDKLDFSIMRKAVKKLEDEYEIVVIDSPPGLGPDALAAITSAKEMILMLTPDPVALADAMKMQILAEKNDVKIAGFITNRVLNDRNEIKTEELEAILKLKSLGALPEDIEVRKASLAQNPVILASPESQFSKALRLIASQMIHQPIPMPVKAKKRFFSGIGEFFRKIFGRKQEATPELKPVATPTAKPQQPQ
ncbi:TPA: P-loop NTPase [Candidatus Micrarchaeota archaeon]|nr:P-loop NTPase [Candidatus Micrarchaeota archaeon]